MTDHELIEQFIHGDENAFNNLVRRHQSWVLNFVEQTVRDSEAAKDISQDIFVKVYFALPKFRFEAEFKTWLYRIVINQMNSHFRKEKLLSWFRVDLPDQIASEDETVQEQPRKDLVRLVNQLPRVQRNVTVLRLYQQLQFKQVAAILAITENSAKVSFHKAKKNLERMSNGLISR